MDNSKKLILSGIMATIIISTAILYTTNEIGEIIINEEKVNLFLNEKIPKSLNQRIVNNKIKFDINFSKDSYIKLNNIFYSDKHNVRGDFVPGKVIAKSGNVAVRESSYYNIIFDSYLGKSPYVAYENNCTDKELCSPGELRLYSDGLEYYDPELVNLTGDCDSTCYIVTPYYNATLTEGTVNSLFYFNLTGGREWVKSEAANTALGEPYSGTWLLRPIAITTTNCSVTNLTDSIFISCLSGFSNWTFYDKYFKSEITYSSAYRIYNYALGYWNGSIGKSIIWNGTSTKQDSPGAYADWDSTTGKFAVLNSTENQYLLAIIWNESSTTDFDYLREWGSGAQNYLSMSIGRENEITAGVLTTTFYRVYKVNESAAGNARITTILDCFKANHANDCTFVNETEEPPAEQTLNCVAASGHPDCRCNFTSNEAIAGNTTFNNSGLATLSANWTFTGTGQFIDIPPGCTFDINGGGFN